MKNNILKIDGFLLRLLIANLRNKLNILNLKMRNIKVPQIFSLNFSYSVA